MQVRINDNTFKVKTLIDRKSKAIGMMGKDFDNPWGLTTPKGEIKKMSAVLDGAT